MSTRPAPLKSYVGGVLGSQEGPRVSTYTETLEITALRDHQSSDELLGVLLEPTTQAEGTLAWSIRFGDVRRSSNSAGVAEDELLGPVGAIVGAIASQGRSSSVEVEGKMILTLNNSPITEESDSTSIGTIRTTVPFSTTDLSNIRRLQDEFASELNATESQQISLGSSSTPRHLVESLNPITSSLEISNDVGASNMAPLLVANPFAG